VRAVILVAVGGALGAVARYLVGTWMVSRMGTGFPWHTFVVNVSGAFLIGVLMALALDKGVASGNVVLLVGIGLLGGFTTFSTLAFESIVLAERGLGLAALGNVFGTAIVGLAAAWLGIVVGRAV
jgi:CrcB protein